jgi:hypothetical protein
MCVEIVTKHLMCVETVTKHLMCVETVTQHLMNVVQTMTKHLMCVETVQRGASAERGDDVRPAAAGARDATAGAREDQHVGGKNRPRAHGRDYTCRP